jgi:Spy/CpxP family protein refolding chaperone
MKRTFAVLILVFSLTAALVAQPGSRRGPGPAAVPGMAWEGRGYALNALDLTEDQEQKIDDLRLEHQKEMIPLRTELDELRASYRLMVVDEQVSESEIEKNLKKQNDVLLKRRMEQVRHIREVRSLLTDEQKTRFDTHFLKKERGSRRGFGGQDRKNRFNRGPQ